MSIKKKYSVAVLLALSVGIFAQPAGVFAAATTAVQDSSTEITDPDNEVPAFASPEEALNAANLAEEAALADESLKTALNDLERAHDALMVAVQSRDRNAISIARRAMDATEEAYMRELAEASGVAESDIYSMHDTGMEWGQIGHELGVHPDMLGLGSDARDTAHDQGMKPGVDHMSGVGDQELSEATTRNMESGWSSGHGSTIQTGIHEPGTGLDGSGMISGAGGMVSGIDRNDTHDSLGRDDHDAEMSGSSMDSSGNQSDHDSDMGSNDSNDRGSDMGGNDNSGGSGGSSGGSEGHEGGGSEGGGSEGHEGGSEGHEGRG